MSLSDNSPSGHKTIPVCIASTCCWVGARKRMKSRNFAYSGSIMRNCWYRVCITAFEDVKVWSLMIEVVVVVRLSTVCKGYC